MLAMGLAVLCAIETRALAEEVCLRTKDANLIPNGVVVDGPSGGGGCNVGPVWSGIAPSKMFPDPGGALAGRVYVARRTSPDKFYIGIDIARDTDLSDQDFVYVLFDANNSGGATAGSWDAEDFIIGVGLRQLSAGGGASTQVTSGTSCNQAVATAKIYYRWDTTQTPARWTIENNAAVLNNITAEVAYDYDVSAGEPPQIYNVEIGVPVNSPAGFFKLKTAAPYFGVGAYAFVDLGHHGIEIDGTTQAGTVLRWPNGMKDRSIAEDDFNVDSDIGGDRPVPDDLADVDPDSNCFDVSIDDVAEPWAQINTVTNAPEWGQVINRNGNNRFRVRFKYHGPPGAPAGQMANKGKGRVELRPYNSSTGTLGSPTGADSPEKQLLAYPAEYVTEDIVIPGSNFGAEWDHVCAKAILKDFQLNDATTNDDLWTNFRFVATSAYSEKVALFGEALPKNPKLAPGMKQKVYVHFESGNDPAAGQPKSGGTVPGTTPTVSPPQLLRRFRLLEVGAGLLALGLVFAALALADRQRHLLRWMLLGSAIFAAFACHTVVVVGPHPPPGPPGPETPVEVGEGRWTLQNEKELGLKPVPSLGKNWYAMDLAREEIKYLAVELSGMALPYKPARYKLNVANEQAGAGIVRVPVPARKVVTVLGLGKTDPDGASGPLEAISLAGTAAKNPAPQPVKPPLTGTVAGPKAPATAAAAAVAASKGYLLRAGYYRPEDYQGTLIGSFDAFKTSFVVGTNASIVAPENGAELSLAVNYSAEQYRVASGILDLVVILTDPPATPTHGAVQGDATYNIPASLPPWETLTTLHIATYVEPPRKGNPAPGVAVTQTLVPWGVAHLSVYESHAVQ